jgi:hypothetical protein
LCKLYTLVYIYTTQQQHHLAAAGPVFNFTPVDLTC